LEGVASTAMDMANTNVTQSFETILDIFPPPSWKKDHRDLCDIRQAPCRIRPISCCYAALISPQAVGFVQS
jgi:hypothetical protein